MGLTEGHQAKTVWENPAEIIRALAPENPVMVFAPTILQARAKEFLAGFPGLVTYAVKSNPDEAVIQNLVAAGIKGFDPVANRQLTTGEIERCEKNPAARAERASSSTPLVSLSSRCTSLGRSL